MINSKIIKLASSTTNVGLKNVFTHKSTIKNSSCGDLIKVEFVSDKKKIKSMRYETEACVLCDASASLLAVLVKKFDLKDLQKDAKLLLKIKMHKKIILPLKFKEYGLLLNKKTINRINCVILPMEALMKAFKVK